MHGETSATVIHNHVRWLDDMWALRHMDITPSIATQLFYNSMISHTCCAVLVLGE